MYKISKIVFVCFLLVQTEMKACDICGCSANTGVGMFTDFRNSFISLNYGHAQFLNQNKDINLFGDRFDKIELSTRIMVSERWRIQAQLPFLVNTRIYSDNAADVKVSGIGDTRFTISRVMYNAHVADAANLYVEVGAGMSLPTGSFDKAIHDKDLPENFNPGRGSVSYIAQSNAVMTFRNFGIIQSNYFLRTTATSSGYRFGNQFSGVLTAYNDFKIGNFNLIPNAGVMYERVANDQYASQAKVHATNGSGLYAIASVNVRRKDWLVGFSYSLPMSTSYAEGGANPSSRFSAQFSFLF